MGLQADIEYEVPRARALQRAVQQAGRTSFGMTILPKTLRALDLLVHRFSGGRTTFARIFGAFPVVMLTTTGSRSGLARTNPLTAVPHDGDIAILGANYGLGVVPSWVYNLRTTPEAELTYRGQKVAVRAREVTGDEAVVVFRAADRIYPGYADYRARFAEPVPVFVLEART